MLRALSEWLERLAQVVASWILRCVRTRRAGELLDRSLFHQLTRLTVSVVIGAVALRSRADGKIEVFLTRRGPTEVHPNRWHCPGTMARPGYDLDKAFGRLAQKEFRTRINRRQSVASCFFEEKRGWFLLLLYLVELESDPPSGVWCLVDNLPAAMVDYHKDWIIPTAVRAYKPQQKGSS